MHYLSFLAEKLATSCQTKRSSSQQEEMQADEAALAASFRRILEEEVTAGRLHYNTLLCNLDMITTKDVATTGCPDWADNLV